MELQPRLGIWPIRGPRPRLGALADHGAHWARRGTGSTWPISKLAKASRPEQTGLLPPSSSSARHASMTSAVGPEPNVCCSAHYAQCLNRPYTAKQAILFRRGIDLQLPFPFLFASNDIERPIRSGALPLAEMNPLLFFITENGIRLTTRCCNAIVWSRIS